MTGNLFQILPTFETPGVVSTLTPPVMHASAQWPHLLLGIHVVKVVKLNRYEQQGICEEKTFIQKKWCKYSMMGYVLILEYKLVAV